MKAGLCPEWPDPGPLLILPPALPVVDWGRLCSGTDPLHFFLLFPYGRLGKGVFQAQSEVV